MSEVEKASTMSISRFVHSVEAVISDERGNASHAYTATWYMDMVTNIHGTTHKQLRGCRRRTRIPCTASKMELRRMRRRMSKKAPKKAPRTAPRTAPRMAQGWLNTCGIAMPLHDKAIYLQWCSNNKKSASGNLWFFLSKNYNSHSKKMRQKLINSGGEHPVAVYST